MSFIKDCPHCGQNASLVNANPHCKHKSCTWNVCPCDVTYDRNSAKFFRTSQKNGD